MKNIITVLILIVFCNLIAIFASDSNFLASDIYRCMLISFIIHLIMFVPSNILKTEKYYDITGTISFVAVISYAYLSISLFKNTPSSLITGLVSQLIWHL